MAKHATPSRHGHAEGYQETPAYRSWASMMRRCFEPSHKSFKRYGGNGVSVCEPWREFASFIADVGDPPSSAHTLDRIDNSLGYEPGNVRWATQKEQQRNRTNNRSFTANGETMCAQEWAERLGVNASTLVRRHHLGWDDERVIGTPIMTPKMHRGAVALMLKAREPAPATEYNWHCGACGVVSKQTTSVPKEDRKCPCGAPCTTRARGGT